MIVNTYKQYGDLVFNIIGAAMTVHRTLGYGLLEAVYAECLHLELLDRGIDNELEKEVECYYKDHILEKKYRLDMVVGDICVELKAVQELCSAHRAQLFNYLRLTRMPVGLLINFGADSLEGERYAFVERYNECCRLDRNMEFIE
jgi:GxxExxY protein